MRNKLRAFAIGVFAAAWWGVLYPELCFTEGTFEQVVVDEERQELTEHNPMKQELYEGLLEASGDEIVIRSRFLEWYQENVAGKGKK